MMAEFLHPIEVNADELALDAIAQVDPGGHHFGTAHTLARYEKAFYIPMLSSRQNFESWQETGSLDAAHRANATWKRMLTEYQRPPMDPAVEEALADFVARRKVEIGRAA
jgi:trimethylamine--corrinoid protein Co-methyltransferase